MREKVRLEVHTTPSNRDGVRRQIEKTIETNRTKFDFVMKQVPHMESAIETLKDGNCDFLAMSAHQRKDLEHNGLNIIGVLPRREPTGFLFLKTNQNTSNQKPLLSATTCFCGGK